MYYYVWPSVIIWPKYSTVIHRTQITNTSKYIMAILQLAKLKGNQTRYLKNGQLRVRHQLHASNYGKNWSVCN